MKNIIKIIITSLLLLTAITLLYSRKNQLDVTTKDIRTLSKMGIIIDCDYRYLGEHSTFPKITKYFEEKGNFSKFKIITIISNKILESKCLRRKPIYECIRFNKIIFHDKDFTKKEMRIASKILARIKDCELLQIISLHQIPKSTGKLIINNKYTTVEIINTPFTANSFKLDKKNKFEIKNIILNNNDLEAQDLNIILPNIGSAQLLEITNNQVANYTAKSKTPFEFIDVIFNNTKLEDHAIGNILANSPKIETLTIINSSITGTTIKTKEPTLTKLNISNNKLAPEAIENIIKQTRIHTLILKNTNITTTQIATIINNMPNLTWLDIRNNNLAKQEIETLQKINPKLRIIHIDKPTRK